MKEDCKLKGLHLVQTIYFTFWSFWSSKTINFDTNRLNKRTRAADKLADEKLITLFTLKMQLNWEAERRSLEASIRSDLPSSS